VPLPLLLDVGEQLQIQTTSKSTSTFSPTQSELLQEIIDLEHSLLPEGHPGHDRSRQPSAEDVIPHLSQLGWEHITFTGSHHWREHASDINVLRPLRTFKLLDKKRGLRGAVSTSSIWSEEIRRRTSLP
jgi:hypothetical protein